MDILRGLEAISFIYREKHYSGRIIRSLGGRPHLYWLLFDDAELVRLVGEDSACFQESQEGLVSLNRILTVTHPQLIKTARKIIEGYLAQSQKP